MFSPYSRLGCGGGEFPILRISVHSAILISSSRLTESTKVSNSWLMRVQDFQVISRTIKYFFVAVAAQADNYDICLRVSRDPSH